MRTAVKFNGPPTGCRITKQGRFVHNFEAIPIATIPHGQALRLFDQTYAAHRRRSELQLPLSFGQRTQRCTYDKLEQLEEHPPRLQP